jgi:hypothetical protein
MYYLQGLRLAVLPCLGATSAQLDLIPESLQELGDESNAPARLLTAKSAQQREKPWRLNDLFFVTSDCFTYCNGNALDHVLWVMANLRNLYVSAVDNLDQ